MSKIKFGLALLLLLGFMTSCAHLFEVRMDAATAYQSKQYIAATELLIPEYELSESLVERAAKARQIALCYKMANRTTQAEKWYEKAVEFDSDAPTFFNYALMLKANGKYEKAMKVFEEYARVYPIDRSRATKQLKACKSALEWQEEPEPYRIDNPIGLNSAASDFAPVLYDEATLIFTSARSSAKGEETYGWTGEKHSDIFVAEAISASSYGEGRPLSDSINTVYNEGTVTFDQDFKVMYFTHCGGANSIDDYCKIYKTERAPNGEWVEPERVYLFATDTINVGHPYLRPDGKELYFSADHPEGYGGKDLYSAKLTREGWTSPKNLGPEINTELSEGFPFIHADGRLYFSSDGHAGMGGLDIFVAERKGKNWTKVENLKYPVNSPADDFGIHFQPKIKPELIDSVEAIGYFASSRPGGQGNDDIYKFTRYIPQEPIDTTPVEVPVPLATGPVYILQGAVSENLYADSSNPNSAITGKEAMKQVLVEINGLSLSSEIDERMRTDKSGRFELQLEEATDYRVAASNTGYFRESINVSTKNKSGAVGDTIYIPADLLLNKIFERVEITLDNIYFDLDKWDIRPDAEPTLQQLANLLLENPNITIELGSHTDARGKDKYNQELSQKRAQSTVDYLVKRGLDRRRLVATGFGESQLVNDCVDGVSCTEEQHQENRRTTFSVLSEDFSPDGRF